MAALVHGLLGEPQFFRQFPLTPVHKKQLDDQILFPFFQVPDGLMELFSQYLSKYDVFHIRLLICRQVMFFQQALIGVLPARYHPDLLCILVNDGP